MIAESLKPGFKSSQGRFYLSNKVKDQRFGKILGLIFLIIGYTYLVPLLFGFFFRLFYDLEIQNKPISRYRWGTLLVDTWYNPLNLIFIFVIIFGWFLLGYYFYKEKKLNIFFLIKHSFPFFLFFIEIILSGLIIYLISMFMYLEEKINFIWLISIFLVIILISFLENIRTKKFNFFKL